MLETQLAQLAAAVPSAETGKIPGQPEVSLESVNTVATRWGKPSSGSPYTNYAKKLARSRTDCQGNLVAPRAEDPRYPVISCSIYDCNFEQALCDLGASVNIMPKVIFENLCYPILSHNLYVCEVGRFDDPITRGNSKEPPSTNRGFLYPCRFRSP
jgi:hypothetical protein